MEVVLAVADSEEEETVAVVLEAVGSAEGLVAGSVVVEMVVAVQE